MFVTYLPQVDGIIEQSSIDSMDKFVNSQLVRFHTIPHLISPQPDVSPVGAVQPCTASPALPL